MLVRIIVLNSLLLELTCLAARKTLGFWAGRTDSNVRSALTTVWNGDAELDIQNSRKNGTTGKHNKFYEAKFCICPGKSEVNSPWIAESIRYGCVPGIITLSLHFMLM